MGPYLRIAATGAVTYGLATLAWAVRMPKWAHVAATVAVVYAVMAASRLPAWRRKRRRPDPAVIARMERELGQDVEIASWPDGRQVLAGGHAGHVITYHMHAGPCPPTCPGFKPPRLES